MELVYRVLWLDNRSELFERIKKPFATWAKSLGDENITVVPSPDMTIAEVRSKGRGGFTTTLRVLTGSLDQYVWIDFESTSEVEDLTFIDETSELIQWLIGESERQGGRPRRGYAEFHLLLPPPTYQNIVYHVEQIFRSDRPVAVICVAHDPIRDKGQTIEMAHSLQKQFAGVAQVLYLPPGDLAKFQNLVGRNLSLEPGEIRIYPPSEVEFRTVVAAPAITATDVRRLSFVNITQRVLQTIQPFMLAMSLPSACDEAARSLRSSRDLPSEEELHGSNIDFENLQLSHQQLQRRFANLHAELEESIEEITTLENQLRAKDTQRREAEEWWIERANALEASQAAAEKKRQEIERRSVEFLINEDLQNMRDQLTDSIASVEEALFRGRKSLEYVVIPQGVSTRLEDLDAHQRSRTWGRAIWKALLAFEAFARSGFNGNFLQWCSVGSDFGWYSQGTAMKESDNVRNHERLYKQRVLPVSPEVDNSGRVFMEAHLKFSGRLAPRMYFYDDTKGVTGKIHIGGIDPHSRWENTTT
jgi:hypothetical protein